MFKLNIPLSAKYVHGKPYGTSYGNLHVYIPDLMPKISMGYPKITPTSLNKSCYSNAEECRPAIASQINTQNFVTAQKSYLSYEGSLYQYGSEISVIPTTEDCLTCKLAPDDCDNSYDLPVEE